jgi:hypothetical protein
MKALFEKLEAVKIDVLDLLQPEDRIFCMQLIAKYHSHALFVQSLLKTTNEVYDLHQRQTLISEDDFYYDMYKMEKQVQGYEDILASLYVTVIRRIEKYFEEKYTIQFSSFNDTKKPDDIIVHTGLETIIDNMIGQVGTDLMESGKAQVIKRFQAEFSSSVQQPEIKNNKISLPRYYSLGYGDTALDYSDTKVSHLLQAIALLIYDSTIMPEVFQKQFGEWKYKLEFNTAYDMQTDIIIKFFKNGRIDLTFSSVDTAEKFWQLFQLENIVLINNANKPWL